MTTKQPAKQEDIRVTVLGGGSWGTTVAHLCAHNAPTTIWARDAATVDSINEHHVNERYLAGFELHPDLKASADFEAAVVASDLIIMGVPTSAFRETARRVAGVIRPWVPIVSLAKGFEADTNLRMTQILHEELPSRPVGVLTGPNLAKEILAGQPAAAVIAMTEFHIAQRLQNLFTTDKFRVFLNHDVVGAELGGALKNVYAVAVGSAEGRGLGNNTRAALMTRGLAELIELGTAMGGEPLTLAGLAGMGDLIATCMSEQSRNSFVGRELGRGRPLDEILAEMDQVAEGVKAAKVVHELGIEYKVLLPVAHSVYQVCWQGQASNLAADKLLRGRVGHESGRNARQR